MPIRVRFDKNGFYHPAFGRLGRGKNLGRVYVLPDEFGVKETVKIPVMDNTSRPPKQIGEKEITRYKNIPSSAEVLDESVVEQLEHDAEYGDEDAAEELAAIKAAKMPKVATPEALEKVTGGPKKPKATGANERTTGARKKRSRAAPAEA